MAGVSRNTVMPKIVMAIRWRRGSHVHLLCSHPFLILYGNKQCELTDFLFWFESLIGYDGHDQLQILCPSQNITNF